jgi:hypothetical protein
LTPQKQNIFDGLENGNVKQVAYGIFFKNKKFFLDFRKNEKNLQMAW